MARSTGLPDQQQACWLKAFSDESIDATEVVSTQPKSSHSSRTGVQVHSHTAEVSRKVFQPQGDELGDEAEGIVGVVQWLRSSRQPGTEDFAYRYNQRYGSNPGVYAVIGYSAGEILEAAVRLAGTIEHNAVREQLRSMYIHALIGSYRVDKTGRQIGRRNLVLQWQDGHRRLIAPESVAEQSLIYPLP